MYPDNYMNPMNNPMTNPNYGYNRMQQVQQMQRAINPQVPNMFGQVEQPQQMQSFISAVPVTCLEEAKATRIALDGSMSVFVNIQDGEIYTKQLSMNGLAELKTYKLVNPQENKIEYVTSNDFNGLNQRVQNIENFLNQLGGQQNESNANDASIQPTPANAKSSNRFIKSSSITTTSTNLVITLSTTPTLTNLKRFCLVLAQSLPSGANTLPVQIQIGTMVYPVYTRTGNLLRADQIRCRRVYPIIFGSDPNHFSMLCCVPNTVYTPTAPTVPTVEVLED